MNITVSLPTDCDVGYRVVGGESRKLGHLVAGTHVLNNIPEDEHTIIHADHYTLLSHQWASSYTGRMDTDWKFHQGLNLHTLGGFVFFLTVGLVTFLCVLAERRRQSRSS